MKDGRRGESRLRAHLLRELAPGGFFRAQGRVPAIARVRPSHGDFVLVAISSRSLYPRLVRGLAVWVGLGREPTADHFGDRALVHLAAALESGPWAREQSSLGVAIAREIFDAHPQIRAERPGTAAHIAGGVTDRGSELVGEPLVYATEAHVDRWAAYLARVLPRAIERVEGATLVRYEWGGFGIDLPGLDGTPPAARPAEPQTAIAPEPARVPRIDRPITTRFASPIEVKKHLVARGIAVPIAVTSDRDPPIELPASKDEIASWV